MRTGTWLNAELLQRLREMLFVHPAFHSHSSLEVRFSDREELAPYIPDLPYVETRRELVQQVLTLLRQRYHKDGRPLLVILLERLAEDLPADEYAAGSFHDLIHQIAESLPGVTRIKASSAQVSHLDLLLQGEPEAAWLTAIFTHPDGRTRDILVQAEARVFDLVALQTTRNFADYGRLLSMMLFGATNSIWAQVHALSRGSGTLLRMHLLLEAQNPALHALRWEMLSDPITDLPLVLQEQIMFSRLVSGTNLATVALARRGDVRMVVAVANPSDLKLFHLTAIDVESEVERVRKGATGIALHILGDHKDAALGQRATLIAITNALRNGCQILYLVAHGQQIANQQAMVYLEQADGSTAQLAAQDVVAAIAQLQVKPALVVLASCQSGGTGYGGALLPLGALLAQAGVAAVIGFQDQVTVYTISQFMPVLFEALVTKGLPIDQSLALARKAIGENWWQAVLWLRTLDGRLWE